jgi:hypothetical protein
MCIKSKDTSQTTRRRRITAKMRPKQGQEARHVALGDLIRTPSLTVSETGGTGEIQAEDMAVTPDSV